jgi:hypothetical protein
MPPKARLKRRAFLVDARVLRRARKALGIATDSETIRVSLERIAEMEQFWQFMKKSRNKLKPGSIATT